VKPKAGVGRRLSLRRPRSPDPRLDPVSAHDNLWQRLQVFVPEGGRKPGTKPVDLVDAWVIRLLETLTDLFGGATAYGRGFGVWKFRGKVAWDRVTVVESGIPPASPARHRKWMDDVIRLLQAMRGQLRQKAVAYAIDGQMFFVSAGGRRAGRRRRSHRGGPR
jgi:hypothetical protein